MRVQRIQHLSDPIIEPLYRRAHSLAWSKDLFTVIRPNFPRRFTSWSGLATSCVVRSHGFSSTMLFHDVPSVSSSTLQSGKVVGAFCEVL